MKAGHGNYCSAANWRARRSYCGAEMLSVMTLQSAGDSKPTRAHGIRRSALWHDRNAGTARTLTAGRQCRIDFHQGIARPYGRIKNLE